MTGNDFTKSLISEVERQLKDISFIGTDGKPKKIKGYPQELPLSSVHAGWETEGEPKSEEELFPYFLVQISEIIYEEEEAKAKVWILLALYDDRQQMTGWENINNAVERLTARFRTNPVLSEYYYCDRTMKAAYPDEGDWPHFFAGLEMTWHLPIME